jgi:hypothetical protein
MAISENTIRWAVSELCTLHEAAAVAQGTSHMHIHRWENGKGSHLTREQLARLEAHILAKFAKLAKALGQHLAAKPLELAVAGQ